MTIEVLQKLLVIFAVVVIGWLAGRYRWLVSARPAGAGVAPTGEDGPARLLSNAAFYLFIPALLFRTTARIDLATLPWRTLAAFFAPLVGLMVTVYAWQRWRAPRRHPAQPVAAPAVRAIAATFGNTLQVGIPMATALFGEAGLAVHVTIISLHALILLTVLTTLVELDLARARQRSDGRASTLGATLGTTARQTIIHPVVLPVLAGLVWNLSLGTLPALLDELLSMLAQAVVPVCLLVIGLSLAQHGVRGAWRESLATCVLKLLVLPALVLAFAHGVLGLQGVTLAVLVMAAALPAGANALIFSQRYRALEGETSASVVLSTLGFVLTAPLWLGVLAWLA